MNYKKINNLINESKLSKQEISNQCGFSRPTLDAVLKCADVKVSTITALSAFFKVPVSYFFDEDMGHINQNGKGNAASVYGNAIVGELEIKDKEIEHLQQLLEEKERTIQILINK